MPTIDETKREALVRLWRGLSDLAKELDPEARQLLDELLLEFWLRTNSTGTALLDGLGMDRTLRALREWLDENGFGDELGATESEEAGGSTGTSVRF